MKKAAERPPAAYPAGVRVRMGRRMAEALRIIAEQRHMTMSALVREFVREALAKRRVKV